MNGNEVWLTGANWFGFNCSENCPHYLWSADADDCLTEIADRGINIIRFPIATELIVSWMNGKPNPVSSFSANADPAYKINADFCEADGKTPVDSMQVFDIMMKKCKEHGIKAFIDIHSHIIYGADDGAQSMTEAIRMLQADRDQGAVAVFATPHYGRENNNFLPPAAGVREKFELLKERAFSGWRLSG